MFVLKTYKLKLYVCVFLSKCIIYMYKYTCIYIGQREREKINGQSIPTDDVDKGHMRIPCAIVVTFI